MRNAVTNKFYGEIITSVHQELEQSDDQSFGVFSEVDKKLKLPSGSSWDASGYKDYCDFVVFEDI